MNDKFQVTYRNDTGNPWHALARQRWEPMWAGVHARKAARRMGWDGKSTMTYYDADGLPLGGTVAAPAELSSGK